MTPESAFTAWADRQFGPAPDPDALAAAREAGRTAAQERRAFRDHCPHLYSRFSGMSVAEFGVQQRPLLDAWFDGWKTELDARGLGFNFKPHGQRY